MKKVKLITGLQTTDVNYYYESDRIIMYESLCSSDIRRIENGYAAIPKGDTGLIDRKILSVTKICHNAKPDLLIAWSPDVDEYLGIPYNLLRKNVDLLETKNNNLRIKLRHKEFELKKIYDANSKLSNSFWNRLKFLFTRVIED